jgi:feruloyl esterase
MRGRPGWRDLLTAAQTTAIKKIYAGVQVDGKPAHFGQVMGAETPGTSFTGVGPTDSGWAMWLIPPANAKALQHAYGESFVRYFLPKPDPQLDTSKFDFAKDIGKYADARTLLNATDPNLAPFRLRGGKLLMYFGWDAPALTPLLGVSLERGGPLTAPANEADVRRRVGSAIQVRRGAG